MKDRCQLLIKMNKVIGGFLVFIFRVGSKRAADVGLGKAVFVHVDALAAVDDASQSLIKCAK